MVIRDARPEELDKIAFLMREAYLEYKDYFPQEGWEDYCQNIMDVRSRLGVSQLIVAEREGNLVGAVTLYLDGSLSDESWPAEWAGIRLLAVPPAYRGLRIGRALMDECVRRCRARNIRTIGLHTSVIMAVARGMYERMGFVRVPEYDFHPRPETTVMAYRLDLD
jgi:ribosomal protein S18 acetylase RimI-like enzyme